MLTINYIAWSSEVTYLYRLCTVSILNKYLKILWSEVHFYTYLHLFFQDKVKVCD